MAPRDFYEENRWQKLTRRIKEEPLIPFGTYPYQLLPHPAHVTTSGLTCTRRLRADGVGAGERDEVDPLRRPQPHEPDVPGAAVRAGLYDRGDGRGVHVLEVGPAEA